MVSQIPNLRVSGSNPLGVTNFSKKILKLTDNSLAMGWSLDIVSVQCP